MFLLKSKIKKECMNMGRVRYNQSGYIGCSMSERAREAYENGEAPKSKWSKSAMLDVIEDYCVDKKLFNKIKSMKKDYIFKTFFEYTGWHHTGKYATRTAFYGLSYLAIDNFSATA